MRLKITVLCFVGVALTIAQTALNNDSIIKMVKGGLSDVVVVNSIKVLGAARNEAIFGGLRRCRGRQAAEPPALAIPWARTR
jgi:hypothetical protein